MAPPATTVTTTCTLASPSATYCQVHATNTLSPEQQHVLNRNTGIAVGVILAIYFIMGMATVILALSSRRKERKLALPDTLPPHMTVTPPQSMSRDVLITKTPDVVAGEELETRGRGQSQGSEISGMRPLLLAQERRERSLSPASNMSRYARVAEEDEGSELVELQRGAERITDIRSESQHSMDRHYYPEHYMPETPERT
ncbi:hypothetical protein NA57DRAFT_61924 [Rhizodiscina lignyota]|uniref:Uncharacterized protein n=1 Tax=Rhizodiscina lignyota TaxID=1504668 RepID=A0A9P4I518_9PEZI|nr:hypothetical protein NA57DRAFT_61924 [Rhizodiscina lignyota]